MPLVRFHCPHCGKKISLKSGEPIIAAIEERMKAIVKELENETVLQDIEDLTNRVRKLEEAQ